MGIRAQGNPTVKYASVWSKTAKGAMPIPPPFIATGGKTGTYTDPGGNWKFHAFTHPNSDNFVLSQGSSDV